jgi:hypothetical protein
MLFFLLLLLLLLLQKTQITAQKGREKTELQRPQNKAFILFYINFHQDF